LKKHKKKAHWEIFKNEIKKQKSKNILASDHTINKPRLFNIIKPSLINSLKDPSFNALIKLNQMDKTENCQYQNQSTHSNYIASMIINEIIDKALIFSENIKEISQHNYQNLNQEMLKESLHLLNEKNTINSNNVRASSERILLKNPNNFPSGYVIIPAGEHPHAHVNYCGHEQVLYNSRIEFIHDMNLHFEYENGNIIRKHNFTSI